MLDRDLAADARLADERGGYFDLTSWGTVRIQGPDARDYLNRMTTLNFQNISAPAYGAFLTGRAAVVALGIFVPVADDTFDYVLAPGQSTAVAEFIEKFHFRENLTVTDVSSELAYFGLWNRPLTLDFESAQSWRDAVRPQLTWIRVDQPNADAFREWLRSQDVLLLGPRLFEYHRVKSGMPIVGLEVTDKDLILEANLELAISRNKGCYPGQEVVERIFTYGQVNRKLLPVVLSGEELPPPPFIVETDGKKAATVVSWIAEPDGKSAIGLAYVGKAFWSSSDDFVSADGKVRARLRSA